ncbi:MAG TPA: AI-2E family transporter [Candidatus Paceibacterota bacterium]|nr:AI-2E family transporter [Verrucomicrobiota bacterium]HRY47889.1 AI-2E family transporter [Candidatus Paceibacterota bacterium]HSA01338.1 AI-2E family transporter [Candidatus Paceibacterota bacterium]
MSFPPPTTGQARLIWAAVTALAVAFIVALVAAGIWGLGKILGLLAPILWPLAVAGVLAYLLDPLVDFFERRHVPRPRAIFLVFFMAAGLLTGILGSLVPRVTLEARQLVLKIPDYSRRIQSRAEAFLSHPPAPLRGLLGWNLAETNMVSLPAEENAISSTNWYIGSETTTNVISFAGGSGIDGATISSLSQKLASVLPAVGSWLVNQVLRVASWLGVLAGMALIPVYAFYFLLEKRGIAGHWTDYLPLRDSTLKDEVAFVLGAINDYLITFFRGQVLVALCDAVLYTTGFLLVGIHYAFMIGFAAVFLTLIPFIGAFFVALSALVLAFVQYGDWQHPLMVIGVFAVVQFLEGFVIQPKIIGDRVGLHPLAIIIAVIAGTTLLGGVLGGILAIPFTAALRVVMFRYVWRSK